YVSKLNAMCEDFAAREKKIGEPTNVAELAAHGDRIVAAYEHAIVEPMLALQPPPEIAPRVARLRAVTRQQRDVLRGLAAAARSGDLAKVQRLVVRNTNLNAQANQIARELKARSCAG